MNEEQEKPKVTLLGVKQPALPKEEPLINVPLIPKPTDEEIRRAFIVERTPSKGHELKCKMKKKRKRKLGRKSRQYNRRRGRR